MEKKLTNKIAAFEYILYKLNEWYKDNNGEKENDLSILKVMKQNFQKNKKKILQTSMEMHKDFGY